MGFAVRLSHKKNRVRLARPFQVLGFPTASAVIVVLVGSGLRATGRPWLRLGANQAGR